ncbi:uncharacterized protein [Lepeophtheirus salmonis]|uniref:Uncharacterized protein n=1 Tax=Lepeophtheirus salmonis TaxID=72036 RepID=A0A0K2T4U4_LEPSM|nr:uncharacterized protein LOC121127366 [Lepeophtheirus salmonis]XP_040578636.1 uncharacterized protein LOC121127366 [Lepeophtheirus salmonis]
MKLHQTSSSTTENVNMLNKTHPGDFELNDEVKTVSESALTFFSIFFIGTCFLAFFYLWSRSRKRKGKKRTAAYQYSKLSQFDHHDDDDVDTEIIYDIEGGDDSSSSLDDEDKMNCIQDLSVNDRIISISINNSRDLPSVKSKVLTPGNDNDPATLPVSSTKTIKVPKNIQRMSQSSTHTESDEELIR